MHIRQVKRLEAVVAATTDVASGGPCPQSSLSCLTKLVYAPTPTEKLFWKSGEKKPAAGGQGGALCRDRARGSRDKGEWVARATGGAVVSPASAALAGADVLRHSGLREISEGKPSVHGVQGSQHAAVAAQIVPATPTTRTVAIDGRRLDGLLAHTQRNQLLALEAKLIFDGQGQRKQNQGAEAEAAWHRLAHAGVRGSRG